MSHDPPSIRVLAPNDDALEARANTILRGLGFHAGDDGRVPMIAVHAADIYSGETGVAITMAEANGPWILGLFLESPEDPLPFAVKKLTCFRIAEFHDGAIIRLSERKGGPGTPFISLETDSDPRVVAFNMDFSRKDEAVLSGVLPRNTKWYTADPTQSYKHQIPDYAILVFRSVDAEDLRKTADRAQYLLSKIARTGRTAVLHLRVGEASPVLLPGLNVDFNLEVATRISITAPGDLEVVHVGEEMELFTMAVTGGPGGNLYADVVSVSPAGRSHVLPAPFSEKKKKVAFEAVIPPARVHAPVSLSVADLFAFINLAAKALPFPTNTVTGAVLRTLEGLFPNKGTATPHAATVLAAEGMDMVLEQLALHVATLTGREGPMARRSVGLLRGYLSSHKNTK